MIDLAYRNERVQSIEARTVYEHDMFEYELGLNPKLLHKPTFDGDRGDIRAFYAIFKLDNGGFRFEVMSKSSEDSYAAGYSKAYSSNFGPWKSKKESRNEL